MYTEPSRQVGRLHGTFDSSIGGLSVPKTAPRLETAVLESGRVDWLDWHLVLLLALSAIGSLIVFCLAAAAFHRRRSMPYLLITGALGALVMRPIVGTGTVLGLIPMQTHHTIEHLLDLIIAGLLLAAIVMVGRLETSPNSKHDSELSDGGDRQ